MNRNFSHKDTQSYTKKRENWEDRKMKENYKLQNTRPLSIKKAGAETNPNYNVQNYKPNVIHAISFQLTSFSYLPIFSASHLPSLSPGRRGH